MFVCWGGGGLFLSVFFFFSVTLWFLFLLLFCFSLGHLVYLVFGVIVVLFDRHLVAFVDAYVKKVIML